MKYHLYMQSKNITSACLTATPCLQVFDEMQSTIKKFTNKD